MSPAHRKSGKENTMKPKKKMLTYHPWVMGILLIPLLLTASVLLYRYAYYGSDFLAHEEVASYLRSFTLPDLAEYRWAHLFAYPLMHLCTALVSFLTGGSMPVAMFLVLTAANLATLYLVRKIGLQIVREPSVCQRYLIDFFAATSIFIMPISGWLTGYNPYLPEMSPNLWHNPSYLFVRPFMLMTLIWFEKACSALEEQGFHKSARGATVKMGVWLFLSTLAKPSFAPFFLAGAGIVVLVLVCMQFQKRWLNLGVPMLGAVLPTVVLLLVQRNYVAQCGSPAFSIEIQDLDTVFSYWNLRYLLAVLTLVGLFFLWRGYRFWIKERLYAVILLMLLFSGFLWFGTTAGMYNPLTDWGWSYGLAAFNAILFSAFYSLREIKSKVYWCAFGAFYAAHLWFGIRFLFFLLGGGTATTQMF